MFGFGLSLGLPQRAGGGGASPIVVPDLPVWSTALNEMRAGTRNAVVAWPWDSTGAGHGAFAVGMGTGNKSGSVPSLAAIMINQRELDFASWSNIVGNSNASDTRQYDLRTTFPTAQGWNFGSGTGEQTSGGFTIKAETYNPPSKFDFAPPNQCDTYVLYNPRHTTSATAAWLPSFNGGADGAAISNYNASRSFTKDTLTTAIGLNSFSLKAFDTSATYFTGIVAYNSSVKEISLINMGWSGSTVADWTNATTPWSPLNATALYQPDLIVRNHIINSINTATPPSQAVFEADLTTIALSDIATGADVIWCIPNNIGTANAGNLATYAVYLQNVATANGITVIDLRIPLGTYAAANAAGYMRDTLHPNATGYWLMAEYILQTIYPASVFPASSSSIMFSDAAASGVVGQPISRRLTAKDLHWTPLGESNSYLYPPVVTAAGGMYTPQTNAQGPSSWTIPVLLSANHKVTARFRCVTNIVGETFGITARMNATGSAGYHGRYSNGNFQLLQVGGSQIGSNTPAVLLPGVDYDFELTASGTNLEFKVNGVTIATTAAASINRRGYGGLRSFASTVTPTTSTTGTHAITVQAENLP